MLINPNQVRAARGLLDWTVTDLAKRVGVGASMISALETGRSAGSVELIVHILDAFREAGVEFTDDGGLRPVKQQVVVLKGPEGFKAFMDDVYETCAKQGGEICVHNAKPENWIKWLGQEWNSYHSQRMKKIAHALTYKITCQHGEVNFLGSGHAEYRWVPDHLWDERPFYVYGSKIGFINFQEQSVDVFVLDQKQFADSFRSMFNVIWETVAIVPPLPGHKPQVSS